VNPYVRSDELDPELEWQWFARGYKSSFPPPRPSQPPPRPSLDSIGDDLADAWFDEPSTGK
jgi:hypothetical protein